MAPDTSNFTAPPPHSNTPSSSSSASSTSRIVPASSVSSSSSLSSAYTSEPQSTIQLQQSQQQPHPHRPSFTTSASSGSTGSGEHSGDPSPRKVSLSTQSSSFENQAEGEADEGAGENEEREGGSSAAGEGADMVGKSRNSSMNVDLVGGNGDKKAKKTRNRKPSSCAQCRKKKLRCDRLVPCGACSLRGEADQCSFENAVPLYVSRNDNDTAELRAQVDRLQSLVDILTRPAAQAALRSAELNDHGTPMSGSYPSPSSFGHDGSPSESIYGGGAGGAGGYQNPHAHHGGNGNNQLGRRRQSSNTSRPFASPNVDPQSGGTSPTISSLGYPPNEKVNDAPDFHLKSQDLCEALSHLTISNLVRLMDDEPGSRTIEDGNNSGWEMGLIEEAKIACSNMPQRFLYSTDDNPVFSSVSGAPVQDSSDARRPVGDEEIEYNQNPFSENSAHIPPEFSPSKLMGFEPPTRKLTIDDILKEMPTFTQAQSALQYYARYVDWYLHPIHLPSFQQRMMQLQEDLQTVPRPRIDIFFLATFMAVCGIGLSLMPQKRATRDGFPANKNVLADKWLEAAMNALTIGRFLDNPSVEAIRAIMLMNSYYVFMAPGEFSGSGMGILSLAVQVAMQLGLHRDPDRLPGRFNPLEAEDRRRTYWLLVTFELLAWTALGRTWSVFNLELVDTKLPLDIDDDELTEKGIFTKPSVGGQPRETVMTSLLVRMKIARLAKKINDKAFGLKPVPYSLILSLDAELRDLEDSLPPIYRLQWDEEHQEIRLPPGCNLITEFRLYTIHLSLNQEYLRLHRPFLVKGFTADTFAFSRAACLRASKMMLAMQRAPVYKEAYGGLQYKSISASIVLTIDLIQNPNAPDAESTRSQILTSVALTERHARHSAIARKGTKLLKFLLERERMFREAASERRSKKKRVENERPLGLPSLFSNLAPDTNTDEDEVLHHKSRNPSRVDDLAGTARASTFDRASRPLQPTQGLFGNNYNPSLYHQRPDVDGPRMVSRPPSPHNNRTHTEGLAQSYEHLANFPFQNDFAFDFRPPAGMTALANASAQVIPTNINLATPESFNFNNMLADYDRSNAPFPGISSAPQASGLAAWGQYPDAARYGLPDNEEWRSIVQTSQLFAPENVEWSHPPVSRP